jgi:hypothetical protein
MGMTVFICIIAFSIIWPVGMIVLNACSGDVRMAGGIIEQERSECLNRTSGKIQPESRHLHSQIVGRKFLKVGRTLLSGITLHLIALSKALKTWVSIYTSGSDMISFRDTSETCRLIMAPEKNQLIQQAVV